MKISDFEKVSGLINRRKDRENYRGRLAAEECYLTIEGLGDYAEKMRLDYGDEIETAKEIKSVLLAHYESQIAEIDRQLAELGVTP